MIEASSEIKNELVLYIPLSKTFPAVDGVFVVPSESLVIYAQFTVGRARAIEYQRMKNVCQDLTTREEFSGYTHILLFLVSDNIYDRFTVQAYRTEDGKNRSEQVDIGVSHYVGKITRQQIKSLK
ncbi:hypothetical protein PC128_g4279 [Phytophthora cactorum]|nr:hypothetical protein PC128_g4279 [Phytophthora cactorum]KAG4060889.1 hypothetical protein PC123_g4230 [Phytophthora cactorum]